MKRRNIEIVLGFLDAIRRRDREAAADSTRRSSGEGSFLTSYAEVRVRCRTSSLQHEMAGSRSTVSS
jgi:hypothetical protein